MAYLWEPKGTDDTSILHVRCMLPRAPHHSLSASALHGTKVHVIDAAQQQTDDVWRRHGYEQMKLTGHVRLRHNKETITLVCLFKMM